MKPRINWSALYGFWTVRDTSNRGVSVPAYRFAVAYARELNRLNGR